MEVNINGVKKNFRTVWFENGIVKMIDQKVLPHKFEIMELKNFVETAEAIKNMSVRGAGAIGATAGYAMAQVILQARENSFEQDIQSGAEVIKQTRPTAQNLFYAVERMLSKIKGLSVSKAREQAVMEAQAIADEDAKNCKNIGLFGEKLIKENFKILTHCNAGWLAFVDWGSALSPVFAAKRNGKNVFVFADETRPRGQGAMLTAWELINEGIDHAVIVDNAAGYFMQKKEINLVITGADRIARNGDTANKIGTYEKAVLAKENNIPFFVAAPTTTIDLNCESGEFIPIEERHENEVKFYQGINSNNIIRNVLVTPKNAKTRNPAFDVTPAKYISGIITEKGIIQPNEKQILKLFEAKKN